MLDLNTFNLPIPKYLARKGIETIEHMEFDLYDNSFEIMKEAGKGIAEYLKSTYEKKIKFLFLLGPGNNGGDGYIAISEMQEDYNITILRIDQPKTMQAIKAAERVNFENITVLTSDHLLTPSLFENYDIVIDAIFGIGLQSSVRSPYDILLSKLSETDTNVISIDLPSGLDCNSQIWYSTSFSPDTILTIFTTKLVMRDWTLTSEILVIPVSFHPESIFLTNDIMAKKMWRPRDNNSHKGENGRIMVIGGSDEFTGAPVLSGKAILRSGVDTLRIAVPETIRDIVAGYNQDFIVVKVRGERHNSKSFKKFRNLAQNRHDVVVMGMGLSNHGETQKFVREIVDDLKDHVKIVLDADAIRPFRDKLGELSKAGAIITPHKAELRFLLKENLPDDFGELIAFVMNIALKYNLIILLKGKIDIITDGKKVLLNNTGTSSMTVGGTGDALAGLVAATNCFVDDKFYATAIASYIMGKAGERATNKLGLGMLASDLIEEIPYVLQDLKIY